MTQVRWPGRARVLGRRPRADPAPVHRDARRVVGFSDSVFAITITLLVLEIRPPSGNRPLLDGLLALWPSYLAYVVTFLFIGQVWANHHVMFDHIRAADRALLFLNTLLLMAVAFLPFATSVLAGALHAGTGERTAVVFYCIAFDVTALTFNAVWQYARSRRLIGEAIGPCWFDGNHEALPARPGVADNRRRARRRATCPGPGRDRRLQRLLLDPDPRRKPPAKTERRRSLVRARSAALDPTLPIE